MAIEFVCSNCGKTLRVPDEHLGKKARCPACQSINVIQPSDYPADALSPQPERFESSPPLTSSATPPEYMSGPKVNPAAYAPPRQHFAPHRGGLVLTLGIVAFMCNFLLIPGILAWVFGSSDLKQMKAGTMDREGESMTTVGMVLGIISVILPLLGILLWVVFVIFMVMASAIN